MRSILICSLFLLTAFPSLAQQNDTFNYDESRVPSYSLPDPLLLQNGARVTDAQTWWSDRRPEILRLFEEEVYGRAPGQPAGMRFDVSSIQRDAFGGAATRKEVAIYLTEGDREARLDLLLYVPNAAERPVPAFLGLNFSGNQSVYPDIGITISSSWMRDGDGVDDHRATSATRGTAARRWPVEAILDRGYALATMYYGDIDPDFDDGFQNGVHSLFNAGGGAAPAPDEWGSIAAWAWGLSRALDYLVHDPDVAGDAVALIGHSRLGKAALWAGAVDPRFALVISNNSGCGGAALSRRRFGETVKRINDAFPHWFADNFNQYSGREDALPVDQHMLVALIAPRPVYIASAQEDLWADPRGEFLSGLHADPVYRLLGTTGLPAASMPGPNEPVVGTIGYHIRPGQHDVTLYDWERYLDFADRHLRSK